MDVLIVYGTTEGQTRKIAEWTATYIREREHHAELRDSGVPMSDLDFETFHAFIIAASVHQQYHQETVTDFVIAHHKLLNAKPSACTLVKLKVARCDEPRTTLSFLSPMDEALRSQNPRGFGRHLHVLGLDVRPIALTHLSS